MGLTCNKLTGKLCSAFKKMENEEEKRKESKRKSSKEKK